MRRVVVLAEAALDLTAAKKFYDAQDPALGNYCVTSLIADIERLVLFHGIHSRHWGCYRMLANRFPFGIYYLETELETRVIAVLDLRRNPGWIRKELKQRTK